MGARNCLKSWFGVQEKMANGCVGNFGESGTELNVSETVQEIINVLHSDEQPLHKIVYDVQSGQFGFVFDDGRFKHLLQLGQEPSEEVKKLQILLDETLAQVKRLKRESGAAIAQADGSRKSATRSDVETKEVLEKLQAKEKELAAQQKASKITEAVLQKKLEDEIRARRRAEAEAAECKIQVARMKQAKEDTKESGEEVKAELRLQLANNKQQLEKTRKRADIAENNYRNVSKQVVEQKDLRTAAEQRLGDVIVMLEAAQQQLQDAERAKAAEDVVTHVAAMW